MVASAKEPFEAFEASAIPSENSARDLIAGRPGALGRVALHTVGRGALIALGLWALGDNLNSALLRRSVYGALAIEFFVVLAVGRHRRRYA